jgi:hypothetical protein
MVALGAIKQLSPKAGSIPFTGKITGIILSLLYPSANCVQEMGSFFLKIK